MEAKFSPCRRTRMQTNGLRNKVSDVLVIEATRQGASMIRKIQLGQSQGYWLGLVVLRLAPDAAVVSVSEVR